MIFPNTGAMASQAYPECLDFTRRDPGGNNVDTSGKNCWHTGWKPSFHKLMSHCSGILNMVETNRMEVTWGTSSEQGGVAEGTVAGLKPDPGY